MDTPKISVIVPVYNVEQYLPRCIDSILAQTFTDFELLLIDDGSPDNSGKMCDEYAERDTRIRVFHKENGGVSSARNVGLDNAFGEYILFIDADDYIEDIHLKNYTDGIGTDIVYQGYRLFEDGTNKTIDIKELTHMSSDSGESYIQILYELFKSGNYFGPTWSKIFKQAIITKHNIRFKEDISLREDEIFTFEYCLHARSVKVIPSHTYNYRKTPNSLMRQKYKDPYEMKRMMDYSYQASCKLPLSPEFRALIEEYYTNTHIWMGSMLYNIQCKLNSEDRYNLLNTIWDRHLLYPTLKSDSFFKKSLLITHSYQLFKMYIKKLCLKFL